MKKIVFIIVFMAVLFVSLKADVFIREEREASSSSGQLMGKIVEEKWLGKDKMVKLIKNVAVVFDLGNNKLILIDYRSKTYFESTLPVEMSELAPNPQTKALSNLFKNVSISVSPNGKEKKIGEWNCKGYDVKMNFEALSIPITYWASTEVPFDWEKYIKLDEEWTKFQLGISNISTSEYKKIQGYTIATEMNMMETIIKTKVLEISIKEAPPGTYEVPKNFTKVDKMTTSQQD